MVQSPSWEANCSAGSQETPRVSRNPKVHYLTHKRLPPVSILGQANPVHIPTSHFLEIHPNIIHPSTPRSPQWSPSLRFPHQDPVHPPLLIHTRHMPSPSHSSRFYHPHNNEVIIVFKNKMLIIERISYWNFNILMLAHKNIYKFNFFCSCFFSLALHYTTIHYPLLQQFSQFSLNKTKVRCRWRTE